MILASLLSSSSFIMTNKIMIKAVGTDAAIILGELCSEYNYWEQRDELLNGMWFYSTRENIEDNTGLSEYRQRVAINKLIEKGLIETKKMGIPCKIYYKLNEINILNCYRDTQENLLKSPKNPVPKNLGNKNLKNDTTRDEKNEQQDEEKFDINNNKNNNNKNHTHEPSPIEEKKEYATQVQMTEKEHQDLIETYGKDMTNQLIEQLSLYKQAKGKSYESDYAAILYWVTERLRELEKKDANYKDFKDRKDKKTNTKPNFQQRDYPPDFFDSLYCN
ncbi:MAG: hypothetical protein IJJ82_07015 [Clostridia bacterium]|nr:hypothetical protein [Clostridia bacterium]